MQHGFSPEFIENSARALANAQNEVRYFEDLIARYPQATEYKKNLANAKIGLDICETRERVIAQHS